MADVAAEDGRPEGEAGGEEGDQQDKPGATAHPVGPPAEENEAGDTSQARDIEKGSSLFGGILVHLHGDVAPGVEGGLDLVGIEAVIGALTGLHDQGGGEVGEETERKGNGEDGGVSGDEAGDKKGGKKEDEGDGKVVEHHVQVLGLPESGNHGTRVGRKGGLFQRKVNG